MRIMQYLSLLLFVQGTFSSNHRTGNGSEGVSKRLSTIHEGVKTPDGDGLPSYNFHIYTYNTTHVKQFEKTAHGTCSLLLKEHTAGLFPKCWTVLRFQKVDNGKPHNMTFAEVFAGVQDEKDGHFLDVFIEGIHALGDIFDNSYIIQLPALTTEGITYKLRKDGKKAKYFDKVTKKIIKGGETDIQTQDIEYSIDTCSMNDEFYMMAKEMQKSFFDRALTLPRWLDCKVIRAFIKSRKCDVDIYQNSKYVENKTARLSQSFTNDKGEYLVIPGVAMSEENYEHCKHIGTFRNASMEVQKHLWKLTFAQADSILAKFAGDKEHMEEQCLFVHTSGGSVPWLHIRFDEYLHGSNYLKSSPFDFLMKPKEYNTKLIQAAARAHQRQAAKASCIENAMRRLSNIVQFSTNGMANLDLQK